MKERLRYQMGNSLIEIDSLEVAHLSFDAQREWVLLQDKNGAQWVDRLLDLAIRIASQINLDQGQSN